MTEKTEALSLKWGTLKGWDLNEDGEAIKALRRYFDAGKHSISAAMQRDNDAQKQAICEVIDAVNTDRIYLDWDGRYVDKEEAKKYVLEYGKE